MRHRKERKEKKRKEKKEETAAAAAAADEMVCKDKVAAEEFAVMKLTEEKNKVPA